MTPAKSMPADGWLRRNRWWLAGAVVLGAMAFILPYRAAQHEYGRRTYTHPVQAAAEGWTAYEGSRWRLIGVRREPVLGTAAPYLHSEAAIVHVVYEVIPGRDVDMKRLNACRGRLQDARGRVWGGQAFLNELDSKTERRIREQSGLESGCASRSGPDFSEVKARPTRPFRFRHSYLVPRELPGKGLRGEIMLDPFNTVPPGSYISFDLDRAPAPPSPG
jgi:hypothetical protein